MSPVGVLDDQVLLVAESVWNFPIGYSNGAFRSESLSYASTFNAAERLPVIGCSTCIDGCLVTWTHCSAWKAISWTAGLTKIEFGWNNINLCRNPSNLVSCLFCGSDLLKAKRTCTMNNVLFLLHDFCFICFTILLSSFPSQPLHPKEAATWTSATIPSQSTNGIFPAEAAFKWADHSQRGHIIGGNPLTFWGPKRATTVGLHATQKIGKMC